jgi:hypothetical protein
VKEEPVVARASERVETFFQQYERNIADSDPAVIAAQYGESFVFSGPQGTQAVRRDDFVKVLPKGQSFFKSVGLRSSTVLALEEAGVDDCCVLVKAQWRLKFEPAAKPACDLDVAAMYLLQQDPGGLRIVFQRDYDDLTKRVQALGLV